MLRAVEIKRNTFSLSTSCRSWKCIWYWAWIHATQGYEEYVTLDWHKDTSRIRTLGLTSIGFKALELESSVAVDRYEGFSMLQNKFCICKTNYTCPLRINKMKGDISFTSFFNEAIFSLSCYVYQDSLLTFFKMLNQVTGKTITQSGEATIQLSRIRPPAELLSCVLYQVLAGWRPRVLAPVSQVRKKKQVH